MGFENWLKIYYRFEVLDYHLLFEVDDFIEMNEEAGWADKVTHLELQFKAKSLEKKGSAFDMASNSSFKIFTRF